MNQGLCRHSPLLVSKLVMVYWCLLACISCDVQLDKKAEIKILPQESAPSFWHVSQRLLPHANRIVDLYSQTRLIQANAKTQMRYTEIQVEKMQDVIYFFLVRDRPETVEKMCISLHEQVEETFGYYHPATFTLKWLMISIFTSLKKYDEAETLCSRILGGFNDDSDVNEAEGRAKRSFTLLLARICMLRGQTEKGEKLLLGSSASSHATGISGSLLEKHLTSRLWTQYLSQDMSRDMQAWIESHLVKEETGKAGSCQQPFNILCNRIYMSLSQNEIEKAKDLLVEAREMFDRANSEDYAKASMFSDLAALYIKLDEYGDLKVLCDDATTGDWESLWQSDVRFSCIVVLIRCYVHWNRGELDETVDLCQRALEMPHNSRELGSAPKRYLLIVLASVYMQQGKLLEAEKQLVAAIQETRELKKTVYVSQL